MYSKFIKLTRFELGKETYLYEIENYVPFVFISIQNGMYNNKSWVNQIYDMKQIYTEITFTHAYTHQSNIGPSDLCKHVKSI